MTTAGLEPAMTDIDTLGGYCVYRFRHVANLRAEMPQTSLLAFLLD